MKKKLKLVTKQIVRPPSERSQRIDGWSNLMTGIGTQLDNRVHTEVNWEMRPPEFYEQAYAGGGMAARIVDVVPDDSMRSWIDWIKMDPAKKELIEDRFEELDVRGNVLKTWKWGRAYGGACLHIVTDTMDPSKPLQKGEKVLALRDLSRWDLRILTTDIEYDFGSRNYGHPRIYYLNVQMGSTYKGYPIHWTRMIRFDGQLVPRRTFIRNNYWHDSVLNRPWEAIRDYELAYASVAACFQSLNVDVYKLKQLANMIASGKERIIQKRVELMSMAKSVLGAVLLDADTETYENIERKLEGVAELLMSSANRLVAQTDLPHTKLLGESPDGSNGTGNSTMSLYYGFIGCEQKNFAKPKLQRLFEIILNERPNWKFRSLRELDEVEKAEVRNKQSQTDKNYIDSQVLDPTEVATSRFGGEEYSLDTELDLEGRASGLINPGAGGISPEGGNPEGDPNGEGGLNPGDKSEGSPPTGTEGQSGAGEGNSDIVETNGKDPNAELGKDETQPPKPETNANGTHPSAVAEAAKKAMQNKGPEGTGAIQATGIQPPEGGPSEPETVADVPRPNEGGEAGFEAGRGESEFELKNQDVTPPNADPKTKSFISQTMSEPLRDPATDPTLEMKGPGIPNKARVIPPAKGNGLTAPDDPTVEEKKDAAEPKPNKASVIIVKKGDSFLMGKRRDSGKWTLPGGGVDPTESHHAGGLRELQEETGIRAKRLKFLGARMVESKMGQPTHVNIYQHKHEETTAPTNKGDPDKEISTFRWVPANQPLPKDILENLHHPNNVALQHMGLLK